MQQIQCQFPDHESMELNHHQDMNHHPSLSSAQNDHHPHHQQLPLSSASIPLSSSASSYYPLPSSNGHFYANYSQNSDHGHWSEAIYQLNSVSLSDWSIAGGSDYGQLPFFIDSGDILLDLDGVKVAGLTRGDVCEMVNAREVHDVKAVTAGAAYGLPVELREYLSRRFVRGSVDHDLQATIRDNVYLRTIPCTTRPPRHGEADGVDYKFVTREQFIEMDRSGVLLESGAYAGHFYGTPLPLSATPITGQLNNNHNNDGMVNNDNNHVNNNNVNNLPPNYEQTVTTSGSVGSSMALKRRRNRSNIAAIDASSLPHGWERISDAHYGVYYIDHINKRTQYERPYETELVKGSSGFGFTLIEMDKGLVVVKSIIPNGPAYASGVIQPGDVLVSVSGVSVAGLQHSDIARLFATFSVGDRVKLTFARGFQLPVDLAEEEVDFITFTLFKGEQGFGFTISDAHTGQKVKKILDVDRCGALKQGDILMSLNGRDLSSITHLEVVDALKQCPIDESAVLMVKRKKRFRSKTPMTLESSAMSNWDKDRVIAPQRNCKTPNAEMMMMRRDMDWGVSMDQHLDHGGHGNHVNQDFGQTINSNNQTQSFVPHHETMKSYSAPLLHPPSLTMPMDSMDHPSLLNSDMPSSVSTVTGDDIDFEYYRASLMRSESGFGFRIVGGAEEGRNVAIGSIVIGGVAHRDGVLKAGDEIISINDRNVMGAAHQDVVSLMSQTGPSVSILVRRRRDSDAYDVSLYRDHGEGFGFVIISCGACALIGRIIDGSPAQRCQRLHIRDRIIAVNGQDITNMTHPDIVNMIKESGSTLHLRIIPADCYTVELIRGPKGFGFSIRGGAEFNGMPLFILRIAQDGPAYSLLSVGDEIIEINGYTTAGLTHADAVTAISQSGPAVKLKLRRNYQNNYPPPPPMAVIGGAGYGATDIHRSSDIGNSFSQHIPIPSSAQ